MYHCKFCKKEFDNNHKLNGHIGHCKSNPKYDPKRYNTSGLLKGSIKQERFKFKFTCVKCGNSYELELSKNQLEKEEFRKHCSIKCANQRKISQETKNKISESASKHKHADITKICKNCKKEFAVKYSKRIKTFCSRSCSAKYNNRQHPEIGKNGGIKSALMRCKRSKNEILFAQLCQLIFSDVKTNENIFNGWDADVIINDIKVAVLWNGVWHYKKITKKHSLEQVKNRDAIKIKEITNAGYIPYVIQDMGKYNPDFVKNQFEQFKKYFNIAQ